MSIFCRNFISLEFVNEDIYRVTGKVDHLTLSYSRPSKCACSGRFTTKNCEIPVKTNTFRGRGKQCRKIKSKNWKIRSEWKLLTIGCRTKSKVLEFHFNKWADWEKRKSSFATILQDETAFRLDEIFVSLPMWPCWNGGMKICLWTINLFEIWWKICKNLHLFIELSEKKSK